MNQTAEALRERLAIVDCLDVDLKEVMCREVRQGVACDQVRLPSKYFYDARGSRLFEEICDCPEYYPTDKEMEILAARAAEIVDFFGEGGGDLVELGSGSRRKITTLLDALGPEELARVRYVPVDISRQALVEAAEGLIEAYDDLEVLGVVADFTRHLDALPQGRKLILFLGGTIGNFAADEAVSFLSSVAEAMDPGDRLLLGLDMLKPVEVIEAAYNDARGITARFNLNILTHLNRELGADFDLAAFEHLAFFNRDAQRIEMHLKAKEPVRVEIAELELGLELAPGQTIHTEISQKFSPARARQTFAAAGLSPERWFQDPQGWFSLVELSPAG